MGGSSGGQSSSSRPLTGPERADIYSSAISNLAASAPDMFRQTGGTYNDKGEYVPSYGLNAPSYDAPSFQSGYQPITWNEGDYTALQDSMMKGSTAGLDYAKAKDIEAVNNDAAKRGIWSSGLAEQLISNKQDSYAPQYAKAGADATQARYAMEQQAKTANQGAAQANAQAQNTFNLTNAQQTNSNKWAPLNYLQGVWNGTGGSVSNSSGSNLGFNI